MVSPFHNIGIIGVGLIGRALLEALKDKPDVKLHPFPFPVDKNTFEALVKKCDLIIIATPIDQIVEAAKRIQSDHSLVVMDVGSVKTTIAQEFEKLTSHTTDFVATHPFATISFRDRPWAIVPHAKNDKENVEKIQSFLRMLGAKTVILTAQEHDEQAALISHIPAIIAREYLQFVKKNLPEALEVAGPGFESFTRLAHDNPEMHRQIEEANSAIIEKYLKLWREREK